MRKRVLRRLKGAPDRRCVIWISWGLLLAAALTSVQALGQSRVSLSVSEALVVAVRGQPRLTASRTLTVSLAPLRVGAKLTAGDRVETPHGSSLVLQLADGSVIEVLPDTQLELLDFSGGIRQLFRIWLGNVRLKIHRLTGASDSYQMHSPVATIGVRGTEFQIEVARDGETKVRVYKGLVAVNPSRRGSKEILVPAGQELTIRPLRQPGSPVPFERLAADNFRWESSGEARFDAVLEPAELPSVARFLAFEDAHFDALENPAYASRVHEPSGRFYLSATHSASFFEPEISALNSVDRVADLKTLFATDRRGRDGAASQFSYFQPMGKWVLAGVHQFREGRESFDLKVSRLVPTVFGSDIAIEQTGDSEFAPNVDHSSRVNRAVVIAAREFSGHTLAFSVDWTRSTGGIDTVYELRPNGVSALQETSKTSFNNQSRRFSVGYRTDTRIGSVGAFYRLGILSGSTSQREHVVNGETASLARFSTTGTSHEVGLRWQKRVLPNLSLGVVGSLLRSDLDERVRGFRIADSEQRIHFWVPSVGIGAGGRLGDHVHYAVDYLFSAIHEHSRRREFSDGRILELVDENRFDHAIHSWVQVDLPARWSAGFGVTSLWTAEAYDGSFQRDALGRRLDGSGRPQPPHYTDTNSAALMQFGFSVGRRIGRDYYLEYSTSRTAGAEIHPFSHGLVFRLAF